MTYTNPLKQTAVEIDNIITHPDNPSDDELQRLTSLFYFIKSIDSDYRKDVRFESIIKFCKKDYPENTRNEISARFRISDELTNLDRNIESEIIDAVHRVLGTDRKIP